MTALTIPGALRASAERFSTAPAIEDGGKRLSFVELLEASEQAAATLLELGIERGDRVAIWAPNGWHWIVAALGALSAGAVIVPINTRFKGREAGYALEKSRARVLFTVSEFLGTEYPKLLAAEYGGPTARGPFAALTALERVVVFGEQRENSLGWQEFLARGRGVKQGAIEQRAAGVTGDDLSDLLFTSGTTGEPKGVMTSHAQNVRAFEAWADIVGLTASDRYLIVAPFFHAFGYKAGWLAALLRGATILPHAVFDVRSVLARISRDRVSVLPGPPTLYQSLLGEPDLARFDLTNLRLAVTGAASIPVQLVHRMKQELRFETVITGYGLTEACGIATMCRQGDALETIAGTSGRAIPDVELKILADDGSDAAPGEPGEVVIRGYNVMRGYFEDPERTREVIDRDGWLRTGDIGVLDERGYLRVTDRKKDMFIVGGFNCYPAEIENSILANPDVAQVAVVGVPDERLGEVGMAFIVLKNRRTTNVSAASVPELVAWCRNQMANYKVPRHVELVASLPLNAAGKVDKPTLRAEARARVARNS
jgi:HIP---CoA ligase